MLVDPKFRASEELQGAQRPAMAAPKHSELLVESSDSPSKPEDFVTVGDYRLVKPYHFDFCCNVRQRWFGQSIIDIFSREFPARDRQYYLKALADGRLRVEGCDVTPDTPLRDGQRMRHFIHRHEPPVPAGPIPVVGQSAEVVAVCKPAGMPVHVAGQYRKNTVLGVLTAERSDLGPLFPIHRLDKPVSGLLLFARSAEAAARLCRKIEGREVDKVYVARVLGRFPAGTAERPVVVADAPLSWDPVANLAMAHPEAAAVAEAAAAAQEAGQRDEAANAVAPSAAQQQQQRPQQHASEQQEQRQEGGGGEYSLAEERKQRKQQKKAAKAAKAQRQAVAAAAAEAKAAAAKVSSRGPPKPSLTEFRLLAVAEDGLTSIVECRPRTGRTHQIRVHLQYLGHPIANDAQYGGTFGGPLASRHMAQQLGVQWRQPAAAAGAAGAAAGVAVGAAAAVPAANGGSSTLAEAGEAAAAGPCSTKRQRVEAAPAGASGATAGGVGDGTAEGAAGVETAGAGADASVRAARGVEQAHAQLPADAGGQQRAGTAHQAQDGEADAAGEDAYTQNRAFRSRPEFEAGPELHDPFCIHCPYFAPRDYPLDLRPLWLHARTYSCSEGSWSFCTELPEWASPDWHAAA